MPDAVCASVLTDILDDLAREIEAAESIGLERARREIGGAIAVAVGRLAFVRGDGSRAVTRLLEAVQAHLDEEQADRRRR